MLDQALATFRLVPDYDLDVMVEDQSPSGVASLVLSRFETVLRREQPDWVMVQGDTTSAAASSLCAFYLGLRVAHVEAGLRTQVRRVPFPEEINRRLVAVLADLHFAPTSRARQNLILEGVDERQVFVVGNPVVDAFRWAADMIDRDEAPVAPELADVLARVRERKLVLLTLHRRESFGAPIGGVLDAIREFAKESVDDVHFIFPVHPNPGVKQPAEQKLRGLPNVSLLQPLGYFDLVRAMRKSHVVVTDSGGLQEEGPAAGVPVLTLRELTERPEGVEAGAARVVGVDPTGLVHELRVLLEDEQAHKAMTGVRNPYGDGLAAQRIASCLLGEAFEEFAYSTRGGIEAGAEMG
jgi:UDP-N-acetylglucosamine 2-epimerase